MGINECRLIAFSLVILFSGASSLFGQSSEVFKFQNNGSPDYTLPRDAGQDPLPLLYVHGGGGIALAWLSSSDIDNLLIDDANIGSLGLPLSWSVHAGIKNIVQYEYRKGDSSHNIRQMGFVEGGGYGDTGIGTKAEIEMDYDYTDNVIKFNPLFWKTRRTGAGQNYAYFLIAGKGNVEYRDKTGDGFRGNSIIYGIEISTISKYISAGFSLKHYTIEYEQGVVFGIPFDTELGASHTQLQISLAFGLGI